MVITSLLFKAFLKCPLKCWLQFNGEEGTGNLYSDWIHRRSESYSIRGIEDRSNVLPVSEHAGTHVDLFNLRTANWKFATNVTVKVDILESNIHIIERIPPEGRGKAAQLIPSRFILANKLSKDDKLMLAYDNFVLSERIGRGGRQGKITHGDNFKTVKVKTSVLTDMIRKTIKMITTLLANKSPPEYILNRHCIECKYQFRCREKAIEKDELSLLAGMSEKVRKKLTKVGIFTITQFSYTFRPRRRPKRFKEKQEKYHLSLKALAIRDNKTHIVGSPELKIEGTSVYLDVEGLPDRDFYYLIGIRVVGKESIISHSLWADNISEEQKIWLQFCDLLAGISDPTLIHYGAYETTFLNRMQKRYGSVQKSHPEIVSVLGQTINIVSVIYAKIYFPTYSNGLKEIARYIGFNWTEPDASGLTSVVWRAEWEFSKSNDVKSRLVNYNADDCMALAAVVEHLQILMSHREVSSDVVRTEDLQNNRRGVFKLNDFKISEFNEINRAAYWDYQRERILLKTSKLTLAAVKKKKKNVPIRQLIRSSFYPNL